jgi:hypothetical protein
VGFAPAMTCIPNVGPVKRLVFPFVRNGDVVGKAGIDHTFALAHAERVGLRASSKAEF